MIKVGLLGMGFMGRTHFEAYKANRSATVTSICTRNPKKLAGDWSMIGGNLPSAGSDREDLRGINTCRDPRQLLADPNVDLIDIMLPSSLHRKWTVAALRAGKHVLLEKPMALNSRDCEAILVAARKARGMLMVAHCIRFWPEYEVAKRIVASARLGAVTNAILERCAPIPDHGVGSWQHKGSQSGGAVFDLAVHDIDFAIHLLGKPRALFASGTSAVSSSIDQVVISLNYSRKKNAVVNGRWDMPGGWPFEMAFTIRCEKGTIHYRMTSGNPLTIYHRSGREEKPVVPKGDGWQREIDYFLKCINRRKKPDRCKPVESCLSVALAESAVRSIRSGKVVRV